MTPEQDPEDRIAKLERSPSVPNPTGAHATTGTGMRVGWIVLGLLVVGLAVSGGVMVADRLNRPVAGRATSAAVPGDGEHTSTRPSVPPAPVPPVTPTASTMPSPQPPAGTGGGPVSVAGLDTQKTISCLDNVVSISGVNNTVVLTGRCSRVDVSGIENVVTIDEAGVIEVSGLNNKVTFRSGTPELRKSGIGNTLERG